jgi:glycerophosphoryl diester phosphodiesterase
VKVYVWTINAPEDGRRLGALGVDALITDVPGQMRGALQTL